MKAKNLILLCFLLVSQWTYAREETIKIYVKPSQLEFTQQGVLAHIEGQDKPIAGKTLSFDENGMYIKEWKGPCWLHDLWCNRCGGCGVLFCPMNCSCYD